uniref:Uncharacterized protein n=1 Tax=Cacopsylla melanoneura TaxID=428564 RepID=A0A8D8Q421_9HEMI
MVKLTFWVKRLVERGSPVFTFLISNYFSLVVFYLDFDFYHSFCLFHFIIFLQGRPSFKSYFVTRYFNFFKKLCRIFVGLLNGFYVDFFSFNFKTLKLFTN